MTDSPLQPAISGFLAELSQRRSPNTVANYGRDLKRLAGGLAAMGVTSWAAVDHYRLVTLFANLAKESRPATVRRCRSSLRQFYHYLLVNQLVTSDPTTGLPLPKLAAPAPATLSEAEVARLLATCPGDSPLSLRDRALLEVLYAAGLRVSEALALTGGDLDFSLGVLTARDRQGQERLVPVGSVARRWLKHYLASGRPALTEDEEGPLFVSARGHQLSRQAVWQLLKRQGEVAGLASPVAPQTLRNSCAAHLLDNQADYLVVQQLLGRQLPGAPVVPLSRVLAVYNRCHPRAKEED